jgi:hypothetical protein
MAPAAARKQLLLVAAVLLAGTAVAVIVLFVLRRSERESLSAQLDEHCNTVSQSTRWVACT